MAAVAIDAYLAPTASPATADNVTRGCGLALTFMLIQLVSDPAQRLLVQSAERGDKCLGGAGCAASQKAHCLAACALPQLLRDRNTFCNVRLNLTHASAQLFVLPLGAEALLAKAPQLFLQ